MLVFFLPFVHIVMLEQTYNFIFTSPLSVKTMPKDKEISTLSPTRRASSSRPRTTQSKKLGSKLKHNIAAIIGLRTVTPHSIAYVAVQASLVYLMRNPR
jgi:hypothetical protein